MKKLTLTLAAAGLLSMGAIAHAGNFDGFSLGIEAQLKSTSFSLKGDGFSDENIGGKHDFIPTINGSYTFAVAPQFLLGIGATYDLGSTDVESGGGGGFAFKGEEKDHYSIFVTPGYLVNATTLLYAKISYNKMKLVFSATGEPDESLKFNGVGFGAGVKVALTKNVNVHVEAQRVNYSSKTVVDEFESVTVKPSSTIGSVGVSYKF